MRVPRRLLRRALAVLAAALCLAGLAAGRAGALELLGGTPTPLAIQVSQGRLLRLDGPANSVFIADPAIADVQVTSPRVIYLFGRQAGETNLFALGDNDRVIASIRLTVQPNVERLGEAIDRVAPTGAVEVSPVEGSLMIEGEVGSAAEAADVARVAGVVAGSSQSVINRLGVRGPNQINLRVRIAEVSRTSVRRLGINWDSLFRTGSGAFVFGLATVTPVLAVTEPSTGTIEAGAYSTPGIGANNNMQRHFNSHATNTNAILGSYTNPHADVNGMIDALEQENLVSVLAEPNLTALSGETASFLAGGEFPVPVAQQGGSISIEYKKFGVSLAFTPTVLANGRISMRVRPEVSELSDVVAIKLASVTVPSLVIRRAETTVELGSGQSFAIAGMFRDNLTRERGGVMGLAELPIIGPLFRSVNFRDNLSELVIVVTPYLVEPSSEPAMTLPSDRLNATTGLLASAPASAPALATAPPGAGSGLSQVSGGGAAGLGGFILR